MTKEQKAQDFVRNVLGITDRSSQVGAVPNNNKKDQNGLDDIDRWAMGVGRSERSINKMRPKRKHNYWVSSTRSAEKQFLLRNIIRGILIS